MKISVKDMREPKTIAIQGDEPWLSEIYGSFLGHSAEGLKGELTVRPEPYGVYTVKGHVAYTPMVACSRCEQPTAFPIERDIDVRFIDRDQANALVQFDDDEDEDMGGDVGTLESEDLDTYYLQKDGIDLEMVINDFVQTAIPTRLICKTADGSTCLSGLEDDSGAVVFRDKKDADFSPFAVLKGLKLDDN